MSQSSSRGKPFQSKLEPYADLIRDLRRHRKSYREIAQILRDEHAMTATRSTIFSFVKVRSKKRKFYSMQEGQARVPVPSIPARPAFDPIEALRRKPVPEPKAKIFEFDENKPLTLIQK